MMSAAKPGFEITNYTMDPRQNFTGRFRNALFYGPVLISVSFQSQISIPAICMDFTSMGNILPNKGVERLFRNIFQNFYANSASMVSTIFNCHSRRNFPFAPTTTTTFLWTSNIKLVHFDNSNQWVSFGINHSPAQTSTKIENVFVRTNPQLLLQLESGYARSKRAHQVRCPKPIPNRKMTSVHHSSSRYVNFFATSTTLIIPETNSPSLSMMTQWTFESFRPTNLYQVRNTRFFRSKPALKFVERLGEHGVTLGREFLSHLYTLLTYLHPSRV